MSYLALYRKYRSQSFNELAGQQHIVKTLQNSLKNGDISHAYLFCGPRGTGKTSMARLFAKALNCEKGFGEICNDCENCRLISEGTHPDVVEIDAASNSQVEEMRNVVERVKYAPIKGKYKVYIIDEVHMLSNKAFNALLKTLEEPPADVVFILATTEPHKVLPTIISRCQRYDFTKISPEDMKKRLMEIIVAENISCQPEALDQIIILADGCLRDALSILDQLIAYANKKITTEDVKSVFGLISLTEQISFIESLFKGELKDTLTKFNEYVNGGVDFIRLNNNFIEILKDVLIYKNTNSKDLLQKLSLESAKQLSSLINLEKLNKILDTLLNVESDLKYSSNVASTYEICMLKISSIIKEIKENSKPATSVVLEEKPAEPTLNTKNSTDTTEEPSYVFSENESVDKSKLIVYDDDLLIKAIVKSSKENKLSLLNHWEEIKKFREKNSYIKVASALLNCSIFTLCDELLLLQTHSNSVKNTINNIENSKQITEIIQTISGLNVKVYALDLTEASRLQTSFYNLRQIDKLPRKDSIGKLFK